MVSVDNKVTTIQEMLTTTKENIATDAFKCVYHVPALSQGIILDFSTCDAEGEPVTMEGKLKRALLKIDSHSDSSQVAAAVGGRWHVWSREDKRPARSGVGHRRS